MSPADQRVLWPDLGPSVLSLLALSLVVGAAMLATAACGSGSPSDGIHLPPQTVSSAPPPMATASAGPAVPEAPAIGPKEAATQAASRPAAAGSGTTKVVVVDGRAGEPPEDGSDLYRASEAERRRRDTAAPAVLVLTDENLASQAKGGRVTVGGATAIVRAGDVDSGVTADEQYWRTRARELRMDWREAHDRIAELEAQAADLRSRFYAQDDPAYRDRVIKSEWDRTLDRLDEARHKVVQAQEQLEGLLSEGSRAGAMAGWLREGEELEPEPPLPAKAEPKTTDSQEPRVIDPRGRG